MNIFPYRYLSLYILSGIVSIQIFSSHSVVRILYILDNKSFIRCMFAKYFLLVCGVPFCFLNNVFQRAKCRILIYQCFIVHAFYGLRNFARHKDFLCFLIEALQFGSYILWGKIEGFFAWHSIVLAPFVERLLYPVNYLATFVKKQLTIICLGPFLNSLFCVRDLFYFWPRMLSVSSVRAGETSSSSHTGRCFSSLITVGVVGSVIKYSPSI